MRTDSFQHRVIKLGLLSLLLCLTPSTLKAKEFTLKSIHQGLEQNYPTITHMSDKQLLSALEVANENNLLIFDVREQAEYDVSHIKGAHQLNPNAWASSVLKKYQGKFTGKHIIFYCSVGVRSSKMARYLKVDLLKQGAKSVSNLKQGLFAWANNARPMVNTKGATPFIHPYNDHWGQLITSKDKWRY